MDDREVARGKCSFHVAVDPPSPPRRGLTLQLEAHNADTGLQWVDFGEQLLCTATIRNYLNEPIQGELAVTLEGAPYVLIRQDVELPPTVIGGRAQSLRVSSQPRDVLKEGMDVSPESLVLEGGEQVILASLHRDGHLIATATATIMVGPRVDDGGSGLPFRVREVSGSPMAPRWALEDPAQPREPYVLRYSSENPVYVAVRALRRSVGTSRRPVEEYLTQVIAEGLVEWSVRELRSRGDEGRIRLLGRGAHAVNPDIANRIEDRIEQLPGALDDVSKYGALQRELAALMVEAARLTRS